MAHNLVRAAGALASLPFAKARAATIRRDLIAVAARTARHGRGHLTLHLPEGWHREHEWLNLLARRLRPARRSGLTSPEPVRTPNGPTATRTPSPSQEPWTSRRTGERQDTRARNHLAKLSCTNQAGNEPPQLAGGSRLETAGIHTRRYATTDTNAAVP